MRLVMLILAACAACGGDEPGVIFRVDLDGSPPEGSTTLEILVSLQNLGGRWCDPGTPVGGPERGEADPRLMLPPRFPVTIGVVPSDEFDAATAIRVRLLAGATELGRRYDTLVFPPGEQVVRDVVIELGCSDGCGDEQCIAGSCVRSPASAVFSSANEGVVETEAFCVMNRRE